LTLLGEYTERCRIARNCLVVTLGAFLTVQMGRAAWLT
jgi:hypothetical protein